MKRMKYIDEFKKVLSAIFFPKLLVLVRVHLTVSSRLRDLRARAQQIVYVIIFSTYLEMHEQQAWLGLAYVQKYMPCLSKYRLDTTLLRIHLFSVFTIKRPRAIAALAPLGLLIVKTPTHVYQNPSILALIHTAFCYYTCV